MAQTGRRPALKHGNEKPDIFLKTAIQQTYQWFLEKVS